VNIATWEAFWASPLAGLVMPAQVPALMHLWFLYDERARCYRQLRRRGRVAKGSMGQPVRSPLYDIIRQLSAEIGRLEDRFGLSPRAAERLGVTSGDDGRSLADLNAELDAGDEADPRAFAALDGGA
jgi:P27 family predicted phage terminase small subunit